MPRRITELNSISHNEKICATRISDHGLNLDKKPTRLLGKAVPCTSCWKIGLMLCLPHAGSLSSNLHREHDYRLDNVDCKSLVSCQQNPVPNWVLPSLKVFS